MKVSRIREWLRNLRRTFKDNWLLFKESKIGVFGLGIIVFFLVIALLAPILDIRDPILFRAPEEDVIGIDKHWVVDMKKAYDESLGGNTSITYRLRGDANNPLADRIYITASNKLYALDPNTAFPPQIGTWPFTTTGNISTPAIVANYGENYGVSEEDYVIYLGTDQGYFYAMNETDTAYQVTIRTLDGPITSISVYNTEKNKERAFNVRMDVSSTSYAVSEPNVIKLEDDTYRMYYNYSDGSLSKIYSAESDDGLTWENEQMVLEPSIPDDLFAVGSPEVVILSNKSYRMFYTGFNGTVYKILSAYSEDGLSWNKEGISVDIGSGGQDDSNGTSAPDIVVLPSGDYRMYYEGLNNTTFRILSAYSINNGSSWIKEGGVRVDIGGLNDTYWIGDPEVMTLPNGTYRMYYKGFNGTAYNVLSATSSDGLSWNNESGIRIEPVGAYQNLQVGSLEVILVAEDSYRMYYSGYGSNPIGDTSTITNRTLSAVSTNGLDFIREVTDKVLVGTDAGTLYAFDASFVELWNVSLDGAVQMTTYPFRGSYPVYSPCFTQDGEIVVVGTDNATLYSISTKNGTSLWHYELGPETWTSSPILGRKEVDQEIIYFGTDDGWLYALHVNNGAVIKEWENLTIAPRGTPPKKGILIVDIQNNPDGGVLTTPEVYWGGANGSTFIFVGSDSGTLYKISRNEFESVDFKRPAGSTVAQFREPEGLLENFRFEVQLVFYPSTGDPKYLFAIENHDNGTADPSDDKGILYALDKGDLNVSWRISEENKIKFANIKSLPTAWASGQLTDSLWLITSDAAAYSYAASGEYLAPLAPTWLVPLESGNTYWLGTDLIGHDVFSQVMYGARTALLVGFLAAFFAILLGLIIGVVSGYFGSKIDAVLMRFTDVIIVIPFLPFVIVLAAVLGPSIWNIIIVIAILGWGGTARVIRSQVLSLKERPFIESARVTGASNIRIMFKHIAPNVLPLAFLYMTFMVSGAILTEAALSFIGLGDFTQPSWGIMLFYINQSNTLSYWWLLWPPGLCITFISLGFYLVGRAFEQIVNPRLRRRR